MKKSIRNVMFLGTISTITISVFILSVIFLVTTRNLLKERAVKHADEQIVQISSTIYMFIKGAGESVDYLVADPLCKRVGETKTNFLSADGNREGHILDDDSVALRMAEIFTNMSSTHEGYLDVYLGGADGNFIIGNDQTLPKGYDPRIRPWYKEAVKKPDQVVVSPVYQSVTGDASNPSMAVTTVCKPVKVNGALAGVVGIDVSLADITTLLDDMKIGEGGAVALIQGDGTVIANPLEPELNFVKASQDSAEVIHAVLSLEPGESKKVTVNGKSYFGYRYGKEIGSVDWELIGFIRTDEITKPLVQTALTIIIVTFTILFVLYFFLTRNIDRLLIKPLKKVTEVVLCVSEGDFHTEIIHDREDEIGDIQSGLVKMTESLKTKTTLAEKIADGDLRDRGVPTSDEDSLGLALNGMVDSLNGVMKEMHTMVDQVSLGSHQLAQASQSLSDGATQQAAAIEEISSSMSEIESQVKTNADNAESARSLSDTTRETAQTGYRQMGDMVNAMEDINNASNEISRIMKVIDDIAFQTNLLALNAAVEAARAGQHGKGFAVVADEVRNLAQRSAKASSETAQLIEAAIHKIAQGSSIAQETSVSFQSIVDKIGQSAELVGSIASSSLEETHAIKEVVAAIDQISQVTQDSTASAEETAATSSELSHHAQRLRNAINQFKLEHGTQAVELPSIPEPPVVKERREPPAAFQLPDPSDGYGDY